MREEELIIFRDFGEEGWLLHEMSRLMDLTRACTVEPTEHGDGPRGRDLAACPREMAGPGRGGDPGRRRDPGTPPPPGPRRPVPPPPRRREPVPPRHPEPAPPHSPGHDTPRGPRGVLYDCMSALLKLAGSHGFSGNLWHCYLTNLLVNQENSYSMACEIRGAVEGSVNEAVLWDMEIFREYFAYDFTPMMELWGFPVFSTVLSYQGNEQESRVYNTRIRDQICALAKALSEADAPGMKDTLTAFYARYGVGRFGLHKAFCIDSAPEGSGRGVLIRPILNIAHVRLNDLVGYETAKGKLIENTEAFVSGRPANNCLLYGDAGTGKSSSIKAIANEYYDRGLRIIQIYRHQYRDLNDVIAQIKNRNYRFILYMDDLSFEDYETEYKYLKAVIEGGLEKKPDNVLIYATSNRRHLVRERFSDKQEQDDDLHTNDTVQEKLSLVYRFGVTIYFGKPDKAQYNEIVRVLARRSGLDMPEEELLLAANQWELFHGGLSGRTAQQFVDHLLGTRV